MRVVTFILVFAISSQYLISIARGQQSPEERCATDPAIATTCYDCLNTLSCGSLAISSCAAPGFVCDVNVSDGICTAPNSTLTPVCMCATTGCLKDPNNPAAYYYCSELDTIGTVVEPCTTDPTDATNYVGLPIFNTNTCTCEAISSCPSCGSVASDTSECPASYLICDPTTNEAQLLVPCPSGTCFDSTKCSCQVPTVMCPSCGKYPDPDDPTMFCVCGIDFPDKCGIRCDSGDIFNANQCECVDPSVTVESISTISITTGIYSPSTSKGSASTTIPVSRTTEVSINCMDCGLADSMSPDCGKYYSCTPNDQITGTYYCPGEECFNSDLCICL